MNIITDYWRKCTTCKKPISFGQKYWICSVSTCNRTRTDLVFCDLRCFDAHIPVMNHRDAGAFERIAPSQKVFLEQKNKPNLDTAFQKTTSSVHSSEEIEPSEILVVVSKVKNYIRQKSGMNTSDAVMNILTEKVKKIADLAIKNATQKDRKTVMDRDIPTYLN